MSLRGNYPAVQHFKHFTTINGKSHKTVFDENREEYACTIHSGCHDYHVWKKNHRAAYDELKKQDLSRARVVPLGKTVTEKGKSQLIREVIKSDQCTGQATEKSNMCKACQETFKYLRLLKKNGSENNKLKGDERLDGTGMKNIYLTHEELEKLMGLQLKSKIE